MVNKDLLRQFVERAMVDEQLQKKLFDDPNAVLTDWGFTQDEIREIEKLLDSDVALEELDERISKYLFGGAGLGG
ncbi:MAG: hypothetical protein WA821_17570 [Anaerolineales bacterium]